MRRTLHRASLLLGFPALLVLATAAGPCAQPPAATAPPPDLASQGIGVLDRPVSYEKDVAPVLESRCVVCHACNDAPCQLLLSSYDGAQRGATKLLVYDSTRLSAERPTRLFVDAKTTEEWRARGFFPVLGAPAPGAATLPDDSLLLSMLALGRANALPEGQRLPEAVELDIDRPLRCAAADEFDAYARDHPLGGMPYGMAPLRSEELRILASWIAQGSPAPPPAPPLAPKVAAQVTQWEKFLNGSSLKERITARYLYEHWFLAHLAFDDAPRGPYFRVVRSRSAPGQPIDEIATVRPYDDPGAGPFWYRLRPIHESIVHKTHIPNALGPAKL
jgi:hypothetical protein